MRTWHILAQVYNHCDFCCISQRALHGVHSPCSHWCVFAVYVRWVYAMPVCVLFVSSTFSKYYTRVPVQSTTTANPRLAYTRILGLSSMRITLASKRLYSFYRTSRVNPESERTTGINSFGRWDSNQQSIDRQASVLSHRPYQRSDKCETIYMVRVVLCTRHGPSAVVACSPVRRLVGYESGYLVGSG